MEIAVSTGARGTELMANLVLGDAEAALGRLVAARQAYAQALAIALSIGGGWALNARAGLASVALVEGDTASALETLQPLLDAGAADAVLDGTEQPRRIELTCHRVLARAGDPRSGAWLERAHMALMAQADAIGRSSTDAALREGFRQKTAPSGDRRGLGARSSPRPAGGRGPIAAVETLLLLPTWATRLAVIGAILVFLLVALLLSSAPHSSDNIA